MYSRLNSTVVRNRAKFSTFWPSQISEVQVPKNLCISDHAHLKARHVAKYRGATPTTAKVIGADMLNFKAILGPPLKILRGPPSPVGGGALVKLSHSLARVKIWGAAPLNGRNIVFRKKSIWAGL